jgi:hypothetical protein
VSDITNPEKYSFDASVTREAAWFRSARGVWLGTIAFAVSFVGTELLRLESLRVLGVLLLAGAGVLAVLAWGDSQWSPVFPANRATGSVTWQVTVGRRRSSLALLAGAVLLSALSHAAFLAASRATFGAAGWLWLAAIALVIAATAIQNSAESPRNRGTAVPPAWSWWEVTIVASIAVLALALRISNLRDVPFNIYPDEVMTGASGRASLSQRTRPCALPV